MGRLKHVGLCSGRQYYVARPLLAFSRDRLVVSESAHGVGFGLVRFL